MNNILKRFKTFVLGCFVLGIGFTSVFGPKKASLTFQQKQEAVRNAVPGGASIDPLIREYRRRPGGWLKKTYETDDAVFEHLYKKLQDPKKGRKWLAGRIERAKSKYRGSEGSPSQRLGLPVSISPGHLTAAASRPPQSQRLSSSLTMPAGYAPIYPPPAEEPTALSYTFPYEPYDSYLSRKLLEINLEIKQIIRAAVNEGRIADLTTAGIAEDEIQREVAEMAKERSAKALLPKTPPPPPPPGHLVSSRNFPQSPPQVSPRSPLPEPSELAGGSRVGQGTVLPGATLVSTPPELMDPHSHVSVSGPADVEAVDAWRRDRFRAVRQQALQSSESKPPPPRAVWGKGSFAGSDDRTMRYGSLERSPSGSFSSTSTGGETELLDVHASGVPHSQLGLDRTMRSGSLERSTSGASLGSSAVLGDLEAVLESDEEASRPISPGFWGRRDVSIGDPVFREEPEDRTRQEDEDRRLAIELAREQEAELGARRLQEKREAAATEKMLTIEWDDRKAREAEDRRLATDLAWEQESGSGH